MNQTMAFDNTTLLVTSEATAWANSTADKELDFGFILLANESGVENVTSEMIWSSDCETFAMDYSIMACVVCVTAFIIGVIFCVFGK